jgi:hypothetical protein
MAFLNAGMFLLLAFGVDISDVQQAAVTGFANAVFVLIASMLDPKIPFGPVRE